MTMCYRTSDLLDAICNTPRRSCSASLRFWSPPCMSSTGRVPFSESDLPLRSTCKPNATRCTTMAHTTEKAPTMSTKRRSHQEFLWAAGEAPMPVRNRSSASDRSWVAASRRHPCTVDQTADRQVDGPVWSCRQKRMNEDEKQHCIIYHTSSSSSRRCLIFYESALYHYFYKTVLLLSIRSNEYLIFFPRGDCVIAS